LKNCPSKVMGIVKSSGSFQYPSSMTRQDIVAEGIDGTVLATVLTDM
jgi:hypothetical protein